MNYSRVFYAAVERQTQAVERPPSLEDIPAVCLVTDLARILRTSRATIDRMRAAGVFPIREMDRLDRRPRWSGEAVRRFIQTESTHGRLRRVR